MTHVDIYINKSTVYIPTIWFTTEMLRLTKEPVDVIQFEDRNAFVSALAAKLERGNPETGLALLEMDRQKLITRDPLLTLTKSKTQRKFLTAVTYFRILDADVGGHILTRLVLNQNFRENIYLDEDPNWPSLSLSANLSSQECAERSVDNIYRFFELRNTVQPT